MFKEIVKLAKGSNLLTQSGRGEMSQFCLQALKKSAEHSQSLSGMGTTIRRCSFGL